MSVGIRGTLHIEAMLEDNLEHTRTPPTLKEGRYVIAGVLGKGGNAGVYQAWDTKLRCWRAVKVLSHEYIKDDQVRARFAQEASTMARLDHRNLVQVYDISDDPFTPHIVMELCAGGSVIGWMKTHGAAPPRLALHIVESTARGVAVAHEQGITHRDIKPQNILLDHKGVVKLTDFGIARNEDNSLTMAGVTMGTYAFMAPEQRHDSTKVDERADVYSLGATLFTLCQVKTTTELFVAERDDELFEGLPDPIIDVILKACAYRPRERYANIGELLKGIAEARAKLPEDPEHPPLNANATPLPEDAPSDLPDLTQLEDLLKALALNDNTPTYQPREAAPPNEDTTLGGTSGVPLPERKALPYYMTAKPSEVPKEQPERPSYLADEEIKRQKVEAARKAADKVLAKRKAAEEEAARAKEEAEKPKVDPQLIYAGIAVVVFALVVFGGIVAYGTNAVSVARQEVDRSQETLLNAVESAAPVLSQLDGKDAEATFWKFRDAEGDERVNLALQFADQLADASEGQDLGGVADGLVGSVSKTASKYRSSVDNAKSASDSFAGGLAIRVGMASEEP